MTNSKDFKDFSEQDFIDHPYFQDWIIAPDEEKNSFWENFLDANPEKKETIEKAKTLLKTITFKESWPTDEQVESSLNRALNVINGKERRTPVHKISTRVRPIYTKWMAAAAILLLVVCGLWFLVGRNKAEQPSVAITTKTKSEDIAPGGDKAILTLANGTKVILDTASNGAISKEGDVTVIKLNGQLAYQNSTSQLLNSTTIEYNTITTPKGGQYQLVLSDGSKVWLNAASSLRFPTAFIGKERRVELTGEGYFEIAHNSEKPFHVEVAGMDVEDLGTHFNINSYSDEPSVKTTLLEGKVLVKKKDQLVYLNPGQQAIIQADQDNIKIANDIDVDEVVAWKNGMFSFKNTPLENIMRQLERWYNVDVVYQGTIPQETFDGSISRNTNLSEVLKVLDYSNIRFSVKGNTITVLSQ